MRCFAQGLTAMERIRSRMRPCGGLRGALLAGMLFAAASPALAVKASNAYLSPRNRERTVRTETKYIVLHTTEASAKGSLEKLRDNGECHYLVNTNGVIYRIVERKRIAYHAGVSMWNGTESLDNCSVGIEVVGYHDKPITEAQVQALRPLLAELKTMFSVPDHCVLTHSMVAYGMPNKWHTQKHRGRKRCGMQFADPALRKRIGLATKPAYDPDMRAGRLTDGDPALTKILYAGGGVNPSAQLPPAKVVAATAPQKKPGRVSPPITGRKRENVIRPGVTAWDIAPGATQSKTTFYFTPQHVWRCGVDLTSEAVASVPVGTRVLTGYRKGGPISTKLPAYSICGSRWNSPETYYFTPAQGLISGDTLTEKTIPLGALVFYRR